MDTSMEEIMKNSIEAELDKKRNNVVGKTTENPSLLEFIFFSRRYPERIESKLQKDLDTVKSTLEDYGLNYHMNLVVCSIALYTTRIGDADLIEKARVLVRLLALNVPAFQAITILQGRNWEVMKLGYGIKNIGLICSQYGTNEQFLEYCINSTQKFDAGVDRSIDEMKNLTEVVEKKCNDYVVCQSTQSFGLSLMEEDEDTVNFELVTFTRGYPKYIESRLQKYLPIAKSTLEDYGITYRMNLEACTITLSTKRSRDADLIEKVKDILRLLTLAVAGPVAASILSGRDWEVVNLGYQKDGFCSQFGISKDKYHERLKLLWHNATKEIAVLLCCNIQRFGDILVVLGPAGLLKGIRIIAKDCIVHGIPPASRVKLAKDGIARLQTMQRLEELDLNDYSLARDNKSKRETKNPIRFQQK